MNENNNALKVEEINNQNNQKSNLEFPPKKQRQNPPQKESPYAKMAIKKFQTLLEFDPNISSLYIFIPPFNPKNRPAITSHEEIQSKNGGAVILDYSGSKLCGIDLTQFYDKINFAALGIQNNNGKE